jgi:tRNA(Ile)-lysidine synthase
VARRQDCARIALGHHRDDQAETVLHRLLRGSGLSGLAAMRLRSGPFIRPLLLFSRREILSHLAACGLSYVEDASNGDPAFTRNRIRHELLPLLRTFNPRCDEHLARLSRRIAQEEDYWQGEVDRHLAALSRTDRHGMWLAREELLVLHPALRARVLRRALERVKGDLQGVGAVHLEALEQLLTAGRSEAEAHLPGVWAARRYERLWLRCGPPPAAEAFALEVAGPGVYALPGGGELHVSIEPVALGEDCWAVEFDADSVAFPLQVRSLRAGDRFWPRGAPGRKKLKDFFIDAKLDREVRCRLPLVVADTILWVVGVRRCHDRVARSGRAVLRLAVTGRERAIERL